MRRHRSIDGDDASLLSGEIAVAELIALLLAKNCLNVTAATQHAEHEHAVAVESIRDDVLADRERAHTRAKIVITPSAHFWVLGQQEEPTRQGVDETFSAATWKPLSMKTKYAISSMSDSA